MDNIFEILGYEFIQNAILASILTSITCGIIGTYIVANKKVFISGGISHSVFGGIGIGYYFGFNPLLGAGIFGVLSALLIEFLAKNMKIREDSVIGIIWSFGMAIGIMFVFLTPGYAPNLMSYLFGNILIVSRNELIFMLIYTLFVAGFFYFALKEIIYISYDATFMKTKNIPVGVLKNILTIIVVIGIVLNIRMVGIILVISMLTIPQTIAAIYTDDFKIMIEYSVIFAILSSMLGLIVSYILDVPSGATIIFSAIIIFIVCKVLEFLKSLNVNE